MNFKTTVVLLLNLFYVDVFAQLFVSNSGSQKIEVVIGYYSKQTSYAGWSTKGWYIIEPNQVIKLIEKPLSQKYYYIYGRVIGCDGEYTGTSQLIVDSKNAFTINNADKSETFKKNAAYVLKKFIQFDVAGKKIDTIRLTQANCTFNGKRQGQWTIYYDHDWEETQIIEDASYYRKIRYQDGVPLGIVRDYYISGKIQWEGKLKSTDPDIQHGTCIWYYENGNKAQECVFDNGKLLDDYKEWNEDGTPIKFHRSYKVVSVLEPQKFFINNPLRLGGKSRIIVPVKLPENTVSWYYTFAASRSQDDIAKVQKSLSLLADLVNIVDETKMASVAINMLSSPTGADVCDVYLLDYVNQQKFINNTPYTYKVNGSRQNYKSGTIPVNNFVGQDHYLGIENPTMLYGVHFTIEIVAVTEEIERDEE